MTDKLRPSPEDFLKRAQAEEQSQLRGKLKIYLGAAPGVGKTCAMLQDALVRRKEGLDVVAGIIESHGRREIEDIMLKFEILPRQTIFYRDKELSDFDLDGAIKRNPGLLLIDEMAHTNAPGLRHERRWQDIREILDRGIDVYTTLNVQHIESLNDTVAKIINIRIQETVPDSMVETADTIEIIDLSPEDLIKRLKEGKVYFPLQAELAQEHYFQKPKLTALRELALRVTAERVRAQVYLYHQDQGIKVLWRTKEKLAVCIGHSSDAIKLIRAAKNIADSLQVPWLALHVECIGKKLSIHDYNILIQNLQLAERLGAEVRYLTGVNIVKEILDFARSQNITQLILWRPIRSRIRDFFRRNLVDEIVRHSGEIDIHIVTPSRADIPVTRYWQRVKETFKRSIPWLTYVVALGIVGLGTGINIFLSQYLSLTSLIMIYFFGIIAVALLEKIGPSIFASILSVLALKFFFIEPKYSLAIKDFEHYFTLLIMIVVNQIIITLSVRTKRQTENSRFIGQKNLILQTLNRELVRTRGVKKLLETASRYLGESFDSKIMAFISINNCLEAVAHYHSPEKLDDKEKAVAHWVYDLGQPAGLGTDTLSFSDAIYLPLNAAYGTIGVLRISPFQTKRLFSPHQMHILESCAYQIALALEVDLAEERAKKSELKSEADQARIALLKSVSHDFRKPLSSAIKSVGLLTEKSNIDHKEIRAIGLEIYHELDLLSNFIDNFLQITYLEAFEVKLQKHYQSLEDLIDSVKAAFSNQLSNRTLTINIPQNLSPVAFDRGLLQVVFSNLLDNALKFTPADSEIKINVIQQQGKILIRIEDSGPGIPTNEISQLFEKFYCGSNPSNKSGLGLGLAVCYRIIKAHGGDIWVENREKGGAAFCFNLPL